MEIKNYMEDIVAQNLDKIMERYPACCNCKQCKKDIALLALNNLPPKYISTRKGDIYVRLEATYAETKVKVVEEISKAIKKVSKNPNHNNIAS